MRAIRHLATIVLLGTFLSTPAVHAEVPAGSSRAAQDGAVGERVYAGHQVLIGRKRIPMLGTITTRTETFLVATFAPRGDQWEVTSRTCRVAIAPVLGVKVSFAPETVAALPVVPWRLVPGPDDYHYSAPWEAGWDDADVEGDGQPGATLRVDAPLCEGELYVSSRTQSRVRARGSEDGWLGELQVRMQQRVLGTSRACLSVMAGDSDERHRGTLFFTPVPPGTTCADLDPEAWPALAPEPAGA